MESQLSASKPTGGLPETAREQLNAHMVISQERFFFSFFNAFNSASSCQISASKLLLSVCDGEKRLLWSPLTDHFVHPWNNHQDALTAFSQLQASLCCHFPACPRPHVPITWSFAAQRVPSPSFSLPNPWVVALCRSCTASSKPRRTSTASCWPRGG